MADDPESLSDDAARVHVAAAVITNERGQVLITRRHDGAHQGGLWEFPGGKVGPGEDVRAALARELDEELGLQVRSARPLIRVFHDYPDRRVLLDVWRVERWAGEAHPREGQGLAWVAPARLAERDFPPADTPIVSAARLPPLYLIAPEPGADQEAFLARLGDRLARGVRLVQLRAKALEPDRYLDLARRAAALCEAHGAALLLNADPVLAGAAGAHGLHLTTRRLMALEARPLPPPAWVAASCHDARELAHAVRIGADFAVLSPVRVTPSHPGAAPLGWTAFRELVDRVPLPVYALGGMGPADVADAWRHGAQGIAAVRGLWDADAPLITGAPPGLNAPDT